MQCIPSDWGEGYDNVTVDCSVENQEMADKRLSFFNTLPIKHKNIVCQLLISPIHLVQYLKDIELVSVGRESDCHARVLDYDWVLSIREQCIQHAVKFTFRQCGTHFKKDDKLYTLNKY